MRRPPGRRRQRGVALATILATKITFDGYMERRRSIGMLAIEQAWQFSLGAEALAADALSQDLQNSKQDTLAEPWAQRIAPMQITPEDDPEGEPIGVMDGGLEDMQGRFNLNNLARLTPSNQPDPQPLEQFERLLTALDLEPKWAQLARDWLTAGDVPSVPFGAKDAVYTAQDPPYRTGNWPMTTPTELMALPGFGIDRYRKLAPYVTALPTATSNINICTAPAVVLESLSSNLTGEYTGNPDLLANGRKAGCFPDMATFGNTVGPKLLAAINGRFSDSTSYFRLTTRVTLGTTEFTLYSLLLRGQGGKVTPILRSFGTL